MAEKKRPTSLPLQGSHVRGRKEGKLEAAKSAKKKRKKKRKDSPPEKHACSQWGYKKKQERDPGKEKGGTGKQSLTKREKKRRKGDCGF